MNFELNKTRIEPFSDGVIAINIIILVLELHIPELKDHYKYAHVRAAFITLVPKVLAYLLSYIVVVIMLINHHSLFEKIPHSTSTLIWHNAFFLFAMSLILLPIAIPGDHPMMYQTVMLYVIVMFLKAFAFFAMQRYVEKKVKIISCNSLVQRSNAL